MGKRGLGKGLSALITDTFAEEDGALVREIPLGQIAANPYQPRTYFDAEKIAEMAESIREHGVLQPILVRRVGHERYQIIAGERRFRAAQKAGKSVIPAVVKELSDRAQLEIAIVENVQREDIGPVEEARAYRRLADEFGITWQAISQRVGKSPEAISNKMRLLKLPEEVLDSLERGEITEGHARALLTARDPEAIVDVWEAARKQRLSVRETERLARIAKPSAGSNTPTTSRQRAEGQEREAPDFLLNADERAAVEVLQQKLRTKVAVRRNPDGSGRVEIEFYSSQELEGLMELLLGRPEG